MKTKKKYLIPLVLIALTLISAGVLAVVLQTVTNTMIIVKHPDLITVDPSHLTWDPWSYALGGSQEQIFTVTNIAGEEVTLTVTFGNLPATNFLMQSHAFTEGVYRDVTNVIMEVDRTYDIYIKVDYIEDGGWSLSPIGDYSDWVINVEAEESTP